MWVEIIDNRIIFHSTEPEHKKDSIVFFQENIPFEKGELYYDGDKIIPLETTSLEELDPIEYLIKNEVNLT